jgi:hypothetical protein
MEICTELVEFEGNEHNSTTTPNLEEAKHSANQETAPRAEIEDAMRCIQLIEFKEDEYVGGQQRWKRPRRSRKQVSTMLLRRSYRAVQEA